jgi:hypothetical protein
MSKWLSEESVFRCRKQGEAIRDICKLMNYFIALSRNDIDSGFFRRFH